MASLANSPYKTAGSSSAIQALANPPTSYTDTQTQTSDPSSQTSTQSQSSSGGSTSSTTGRVDTRKDTTGSKLTTDTTDRLITTKNMDDEAYGMLMKFLREQAMGGSKEDQERRATIWSEIAANQAQRAGYSKGSAMADSAAAAQAQMAVALESMLPALTAGVDAAGTSGSAMAALLSQKAAEQVSRNAAQLQLDAAISYGQIANQASGIIAELLKIDDKAADRFLEGLNIAKGAITQTSDVTNRVVKEDWKESVIGTETSKQDQVTSQWNQAFSTGTVHNSGQTVDSTSRREYDEASASPGSNYSMGSGQKWETPSAYRAGNR